MITPSPAWHADHDNIRDLAHYLVDTEDAGISEVLDFLDKPWHYDAEWAALLAQREGEHAAMEDELALRHLRSGRADDIDDSPDTAVRV